MNWRTGAKNQEPQGKLRKNALPLSLMILFKTHFNGVRRKPETFSAYVLSLECV